MVQPPPYRSHGSLRNCLVNPNGLRFGVPEVGKPRGEAPLLPLYATCATKNTRSRPVQLFTKQSLRNCLVNPNGLRFGVPGVGKPREEAPLLPLRATENTRSGAVQLFTKQFLRLRPTPE